MSERELLSLEERCPLRERGVYESCLDCPDCEENRGECGGEGVG